jgi:hypothetical protein
MGDARERRFRDSSDEPAFIRRHCARSDRIGIVRSVAARVTVVTIAFLIGGAEPASAQEPFQVDPLTGLTYPHPGPATHYTTIVTFDAGKYDLETPQIRLATGPGGRTLANDAASVVLRPAESDGSRVLVITPKPASFTAPGPYSLTIRLSGKTKEASPKPAVRDLTIAITRSEPQLDLDSVNGRVLTLVRALPWTDAAGDVTFSLQARQGEISALTLGNTGLVRTKTKEMVPSATLTASPATMNIPTAGATQVTLAFTGLSRAGSFETTLTADSENFSKRQTATISVQVKDCIGWALLVILIGVVGGVVVHWMATSGRAALVIRQRLLATRVRLHRLRQAVSSEQTLLRLQDLQQRVDEALWLADTSPGVPDDPKSIEDALKALEDEIAKLRSDTATKLEALLTSISNEAAALAPRVAGASARFDAVVTSVAAAQGLNRVGQVEAAAKQAGAVERTFATEQADVRQAALAQIAIPAAAAADPIVVQAKTAATTALAGSIGGFITALNALQSAIGPAPGALAIAATLDQRYSIRLVNPNQRPVTGDSIALIVVPPAGGGAPHKVDWDYGSGVYEEKSGLTPGVVSYAIPGTHIVKAKITKVAGSAAEDVTFPVSVEPSQALRQRLQAGFAIWRNDLAVALVAAILASIAATLQLYVDKPFGAAEDYLVALLWGFGFEKTVRGFSAVYTTLGGKTF